MDAVILMILLGATVLILIGALVSLYRYLERKVLFPQLPRLWRGDRNRFLVFGLLFPVCAAGFVFYSIYTATDMPPEQQMAKQESPLDAYEQAPPQESTPGWDAASPSTEPRVEQTTEPAPTEMTPGQEAAFEQGQPPADPKATEQLKQDEAQALAAAKPTEPLPVIQTAEPTPEATATAEPARTAAPAPTATPAQTSAPAATAEVPKGWAVCLASYPSQSDAQDHVARLNKQGMQVHMTSAQVKGGTWYRVCATGFASLDQAKKAMQQYKEQGLGDSPFPVRIR